MCINMSAVIRNNIRLKDPLITKKLLIFRIIILKKLKVVSQVIKRILLWFLSGDISFNKTIDLYVSRY